MQEQPSGFAFGPKVATILAIVVAIIVVDLITKIAAARVFVGDPVVLLGGCVRLTYVRNSGVFLSLGHALSASVRFWLFVVGVGAVLVLLLGLTLRDDRFRKPEVVAVAAIVGGGIGNLIDRLAYGSVRDFMNVGIGPVRTGIFNVADMAITFGGITLLLLPMLQRYRRGAAGTS